MIKEIERLNREIDRIMTEKTKADAQKEVWESRLVESIKGYAKDYGVDLSGKDLVEIKKKLVAETNTIEAKTKEEFERASKIVKLINEGDIKGAWKILGVNIDEVENKENEEVVQEKTGVEVQSAVAAIEEMDDNSFYGESFDEEEEEDYIESNDPVNFNTSIKNTEASEFNSFFMEDDEEEEDEFVIPNTRDISSVEHKQFNIKPSQSSTSSSFVMEDDEEDEFGGFGSILSGSKFKV